MTNDDADVEAVMAAADHYAHTPRGRDKLRQTVALVLDIAAAQARLDALDAVEEIADMQRTDGLIAIDDDWWFRLRAGTESEAARLRAQLEALSGRKEA